MADLKPPASRRVGGLRCDQVLDRLPDFVDGTLTPAQLRQVHAHLAGCDWCERFGGRYAQTVQHLRQDLAAAEALSPGDTERVRTRLLAALD